MGYVVISRLSEVKRARLIGFHKEGMYGPIIVERWCVGQAQPCFGCDAELVIFVWILYVRNGDTYKGSKKLILEKNVVLNILLSAQWNVHNHTLVLVYLFTKSWT